MPARDAADCPEPGLTRPAHVPPTTTRVTWRETEDPVGVAHRYGVVGTLLAAGVDAAGIQVFHDVEGDGVHWVVTLDGGRRRAVLTDDTEDHVGHIEGPWPFKVTFLDPAGVRTRINYSIGALTAHVVRWYTESTSTTATRRTEPD
ncbi:hypothetical protein [Streptomyces sp. NBC_01565]|uniref:hypothetical protein n=1 Tax=Streptomyces sp. NBC_01565 TaxID=2975881 RepID=UPI00224F996E|nr:hypothetical protein [Streptomyces sp. NBC_01565]MCX4546175.1 hypothetical protein [Streptomyces sp. NBC_01565]